MTILKRWNLNWAPDQFIFVQYQFEKSQRDLPTLNNFDWPDSSRLNNYDWHLFLKRPSVVSENFSVSMNMESKLSTWLIHMCSIPVWVFSVRLIETENFWLTSLQNFSVSMNLSVSEITVWDLSCFRIF